VIGLALYLDYQFILEMYRRQASVLEKTEAQEFSLEVVATLCKINKTFIL
jgi:hypothetical protein